MVTQGICCIGTHGKLSLIDRYYQSFIFMKIGFPLLPNFHSIGNRCKNIYLCFPSVPEFANKALATIKCSLSNGSDAQGCKIMFLLSLYNVFQENKLR